MYQGIENLQFLYERAGRSFDDGLHRSKGASRRTARRDRGHPPSAESGAPSCSTRVDTPATGRGNSSLILNRHGGSRYAPQGSVDHRVSPPKDVEEEENPSPVDLEHERDRRYAPTDSVRKNRKDREADRAKDRADYALAQLQVERDTDRLERERKNLMEVLERGGYLHRRKRARTDSTGGDAPRKT
ncbi:unnamed protein product [Peronospora destructor]|uniref:Wbp11/ELF5/Saf1 N-terminal domain-containing protein n=1 Tax=Peronospora destructor TaxID=86335 RepID=A0AAV0U9J7_9STRA|nr:unnamed protein product [Peronospora destructor]